MKREPEKQGVPQGLAVSNLLAEIVAHEVDAQFLGNMRFQYFRFVDDVLLLCDADDAADLFERVSVSFRNLGLQVHQLGGPGSKSQVGRIEDGFDYLGYVFARGRISVRPSSVHRVEASLARVFTRYAKSLDRDSVGSDALRRAVDKCQWEVNLIISGCIFRGVPAGGCSIFDRWTT